MFKRENHKSGNAVRLALISTFAITAMLCGLFTFSNPGHVGAQDAPMADHPVVGSWIMSSEGDVTLLAFTSDGVVIDIESDRSPGIGAWEVTGPESARLTIAIQNVTPEFGFEGTFIVRAEVTAKDDGSMLTIDYTITGVLPDGTVAFDDKGSGTAIPFPIEPMDAVGQPLSGYPVMSIEATPAN